MNVEISPQTLGAKALPATPRADGAKVWIAVGALWFALFVYTMAAWVLGPNFKPNTVGHSQAPADYVLFIRSMELVGLLLTAWTFQFFLITPLWRERRLTFNGLFFLACGTLVLQEPWMNWIQPQMLYNDLFYNFGCWLGSIPGVVNPSAGRIPLPIAFAGLGYFYIVAGPSYLGSRYMSRIKARDPEISTLKLVAKCFLAFSVFDLALETFIVRTGLFIYPSTVPWLTLFPGKVYQFPVYEIASWAGTYTVLACVHFFRNEKGETLADRNFDMLNISAPFKKFARWLAIMGMCQVGMLATYNLPYQFWTFQGGAFTVTPQQYPWFTAGLCGAGTAYACPGPGVPVARQGTLTNRVNAAASSSQQQQ